MKIYPKKFNYYWLMLMLSSLLVLNYCASEQASYYYVEKQVEHEDLNFHHDLRVHEYINAFDQPELEVKKGELLTFQIEPFYNKQNISFKNSLIQVAVRTRNVNEQEKNRRFSLCFVLDISGSMEFDNKIEIAKKSLMDAVNTLKVGDEFALITFSNTASTYISPKTISDSNRSRIISKIGQLRPNGGTNIQDGLLKGYFEMSKFKRANYSRLILLTDGNSNIDIMSPEKMSQKLNIEYIEGLRITTIGMGWDVDQNKLRTIAKNGGGHFYFVDSYKTLSDIIKYDLGEVVIPVVTNVSLNIEIAQNYRLINVYGSKKEDKISSSSANIFLNELNADDWRIFVLELEKINNELGISKPITATLNFEDLETAEQMKIQRTVNIDWSLDQNFNNNQMNNKVARNSIIFGNALCLIELGKQYEAGNYNEALDLLNIQISNNLSFYELSGEKALQKEISKLYKIRKILIKKSQQDEDIEKDIITAYQSSFESQKVDSVKVPMDSTNTIQNLVEKGIEIAEVVAPGPWVTIARLLSQAIF